MSTYPNEQWTRHRTPRVPAATWGCISVASYTDMQYGLATSLVPYVSGDDVELTREQFLRAVIARIESDLACNTW